MPIVGDIVTAAGKVMRIIKFKGTICFMGIRIDCLVADINTTIVSSGQTALENGFKWTFRPYEQGEVTSTTNNVTIPLKSVDKLYPLARNLFTSTVEKFQLRPQPTVFTCLPCVEQSTNFPADQLRTESSTLARAQEAAARLKSSFPHAAKAGGSKETTDTNLGNSPSTPVSRKAEGPFGSALEKAKARADELRAMRRIEEALHIPEIAKCNQTNTPHISEIAKCNQTTTPLRMSYNPLSVYTSKSKLAPGNFSDILSPLSDPRLDEISDTEEGSLEKGRNSSNFIESHPDF